MNFLGIVWTAVSIGFLVGILTASRWWWTRNVRSPIREKLLRPPGESLRRKLESIDEAWLSWAAIYAACCALGVFVSFGLVPAKAHPFVIFMLSCFLVGVAIHLVRLLKLRRDYAIGFSGERLVGEELNKLTAQGCHVFHDVPTDTLGNIDHVVVSKSGIFAVETKTRRKGRGKRTDGDHVVEFDGYTLKFPHCTDAHGLDQARRNAHWLASFLTKATREATVVEPILTLPGWYIKRRGKGAVRVVNHKELRNGLQGNASLSPEQVERLAYQLDQRCRDVEF